MHPTKRVSPFKRDLHKAIDACYKHDNRVIWLQDDNNDQAYNEDVFQFDQKESVQTYVKILSAMGNHSRCVYVTQCDSKGIPVRDKNHKAIRFNTNPANLGLHWRSEPMGNLDPESPEAKQAEAEKLKRLQRTAHKESVKQRLDAMRRLIEPQHTNDQVRKIAEDIKVDYDHVRRHRDSLIEAKIIHATTDEEINQLSMLYPMTVERMRCVRMKRAPLESRFTDSKEAGGLI